MYSKIVIIIKYIIQLIACFMPFFLKKFLWKVIGFKIGKRCKIGLFSIILVENLEFADDVIIDPFTMIIFLKKFKLGHKSRIAYFTKIYGRGSFIADNRCLVSIQCLIECFSEKKIIMNDYSCFGPRNTIYTHGGYLPNLQGFPSKIDDIIIGSFSWTGMSTTILPGTKIGNSTIIAPGGVLTGKISNNLFIRPHSYGYDVTPIEKKMKTKSSLEIDNYIKNMIYNVTVKDNKQNISDFYSPPPFPTIERYYNKKIIYYNDSNDFLDSENILLVGYDLNKRIKKNKEIFWLDFKDYSASGKNDKDMQNIVYQLFKLCNLRFIFVE
ncbi:transferase [Candidatus Magnetomorum sp. HK-1]|nr:transferase [Candidatus Magnetomorum sp. HK-1]